MENMSVLDLILLSLKNIISEQDDDGEISLDSLNESTHLIGRKAVLDSLSLVSLIVDVEQKLNDDHGMSITIADERAMSQEKSPFRTVKTLSDYIEMLLEEQK